ncbi:uncharacterized protein LOC123544591 isoform X2 [Mercenaria mercenaria]|nr:uncharacterized protein LOC123544591 isoform X2 [Mercenaria mercenaria]XP_053372572.1 uncharacterized protein LOC123544591 isoform X2 [Mercenaria mercenaria]XP_053372573.1 uncharacterized protein LOC123544591 isoform X2 [Mercenaria mercenaria]
MAETEGINVSEAVTTENEEIRRENKQLLKEIAGLCNRRDKTDVEKILLLGKIGAGKSSIVNTIIKALSGKYIPKAKVGKGSTQSKTFTLERYISCGVTVEDVDETEQQHSVVEMLPRLPTIFDVAGKDNSDNVELQEILELLIGGHVPPGTSIEYLEELQKEHKVGSLKETIFKNSRPEWKMTKIVFVHSCREVVPTDLIHCLQRVLKRADPRTAQVKYSADIYVVITKFDFVRDVDKYIWSSGEPQISIEEFKEVEKAIEKEFSLQGALEDNRTRWVSYTNGTGTDNPYIDNIALKFVRRMVMPRNQPVDSVKPMITTWTKIELKAKRICLKAKHFFLTEQNFTFSFTHLIIMFAVLIAAVVIMYCVYKVLNSSPEFKKRMDDDYF